MARKQMGSGVCVCVYFICVVNEIQTNEYMFTMNSCIGTKCVDTLNSILRRIDIKWNDVCVGKRKSKFL